MSHEIEANFIEESKNEARQCQGCSSFLATDGKNFCRELNMEVPPIGYCDFFQAKD